MMTKKILLKRTFLSAVIFASFQANADNGLIESLSGVNINETAPLKDMGLEVGMWASAGVTYASHNRKDHDNAPLSFNDRNNEFMFNQLNFYIEKALDTESGKWDIGGRMDFMYGTDADNTSAAGWDQNWSPKKGSGSYYDISMPQLYAEIYAPIGNGITAKLGHFYTTIGYEVVTSPDNFFYSHAYTMLYAEPFTHTGALFSYDINDNFSINGGTVLGWDNATTNGGAWNFLGGGSWTSDNEATSVTVQLISGDMSDVGPSINQTMYSVVATHDFSDKIHYVFQHDYGVQEGNGDWFGVNQYLTFDLTDQFGIGLRGEWFNDKGATRVGNRGANYGAISVGVNYSPVSWFKLRPEFRVDLADEKVFNGDSEDSQISLAMDMIVTF